MGNEERKENLNDAEIDRIARNLDSRVEYVVAGIGQLSALSERLRFQARRLAETWSLPRSSWWCQVESIAIQEIERLQQQKQWLAVYAKQVAVFCEQMHVALQSYDEPLNRLMKNLRDQSETLRGVEIASVSLYRPLQEPDGYRAELETENAELKARVEKLENENLELRRRVRWLEFADVNGLPPHNYLGFFSRD